MCAPAMVCTCTFEYKLVEATFDFTTGLGEGRTKWVPQPKWAPSVSICRSHTTKFVLIVVTRPPEDTIEKHPKASNAN